MPVALVMLLAVVLGPLRDVSFQRADGQFAALACMLERGPFGSDGQAPAPAASDRASVNTLQVLGVHADDPLLAIREPTPR